MGERPQVVDIADHFQADRDRTAEGQFLRPVMKKDGLVDLVFLVRSQRRLERIGFQNFLRHLLAKDGVPGFGLQRLPG